MRSRGRNMKSHSKFLRLLLCCVGLITTQALAWEPEAHHAVGAIADQLIIKTHAADEVKVLLGNLSLRDAAVWADCAKGIDPDKNFTYLSAGKFPECKIYESSDGCNGQVKQDTFLSSLLVEFPFKFQRGLVA